LFSVRDFVSFLWQDSDVGTEAISPTLLQAEVERLRAELGEALVRDGRCRALITRWTILEPGHTEEGRYLRKGMAQQLQDALDGTT
jgi:hypothetical protein